jgi:hypothetical protein
MPKHLLVILLAMLCGNATLASAQTNWDRVSRFQFDWNGHPNVQVSLEIPTQWDAPGDFTLIRIHVSGRKEFVLRNNNGWVKYASEAASVSPGLLKRKNLLTSQYVLVQEASDHRRALLFLFGYSYASSPGSLDVVELSEAGEPHVVLHREEFGLEDVIDLDGDGVAEVVGFPCLSQLFGNGLETYDPLNVYKLADANGGDAKLSIPLSKSYNINHYYGWAGVRCSENIAVVLHPPKGGKPVIVSVKEAEKMTGAGRQ